MPSAWTQNFYHTVFSTKERAGSITPELEARLYPFLGGIVRDLRCTLLAINGMPDHVHLLIRYRADLSHSEMLQQSCRVRSADHYFSSCHVVAPSIGGCGATEGPHSGPYRLASTDLDAQTIDEEMIRRHQSA